MLPYFEIVERPSGDFSFNLIAPNNEKLLASTEYITKLSCQYGIAAVKTFNENIANFEIFPVGEDESRFRLKAPNGLVLGVSEGYRDATALEEAILAVQKYAPDAYIIDRSG